MISILNLFWIAPVCIVVGGILVRIIWLKNNNRNENYAYAEGYNAGVNNTTKLYELSNSEETFGKFNKKIKFAVEQELNVPSNLSDVELDMYLMKRFNGKDYIYSEDLNKSLF